MKRKLKTVAIVAATALVVGVGGVAMRASAQSQESATTTGLLTAILARLINIDEHIQELQK